MLWLCGFLVVSLQRLGCLKRVCIYSDRVWVIHGRQFLLRMYRPLRRMTTRCAPDASTRSESGQHVAAETRAHSTCSTPRSRLKPAVRLPLSEIGAIADPRAKTPRRLVDTPTTRPNRVARIQ
jgi:hypothetical protein